MTWFLSSPIGSSENVLRQRQSGRSKPSLTHECFSGLCLSGLLISHWSKHIMWEDKEQSGRKDKDYGSINSINLAQHLFSKRLCGELHTEIIVK